MRKFLRSLWPDRLAAQIAILMFAAIAFFQTTVTTTYLFSDPVWRMPVVEPGELVASALTAIDVAEPAQREAVAAALTASSPWVRFSVSETAPKAAEQPSPLARPVGRRLWPGATLISPADAGDAVAVSLRKGGYASAVVIEPRRATMRSESEPAWFSLPWRIWERSAALFFLCVAVLTVWLSGAVVSPLVDLARRAEKFPDEKGKGEPIAERGPREMRELSRALNRMQSRIQSILLSRSRALAAISHDLRTIITRIRLRSEFIGDEGLKAKMLADAEIMDSMLHKNLMYLRGEQDESERSLIDLDSVLQTIADQFADMGHAVVYQGGRHQTVYGSLTELQRLFSNLVENAITHGTQATISATPPVKGFIEIEVADDGPGIPAEERARVLEPFVRGEPARNVGAKSGFGLGLSIVKSLVEKAGGRLELAERRPHGLIARVALPAAFP
jgi:signal transduction histidine kinase